MTERFFSGEESSFVLLCSPGGKVLYSSPELDRLMGHPMAERHFYDELDRDEIARLMEALQDDRVRMQCTLEGKHFFLVAEKADPGMRIELFPLDMPGEPFMDQVSGQFFCRELSKYLAASLPAAQHLMKKVPEELQRDVAVILRNSFCQMRLQRDLSDMLAIQGGEVRLYAQEENVCALLEDLSEEVRPYCSALGIELRCLVPAQMVLCALDKQRVRRMLYQLISNAIKAQPKGGQITLSLKERENEIIITVSDLGCGIPAGEMDTVFRKYTVGDPTSGSSLGGVGLGLPLARQIAQLHGGRLMMISEEGSGTAVSVTLPKAVRGATMPLGMQAPAYSGGFEPAKLELSTVLPSGCYLMKTK